MLKNKPVLKATEATSEPFQLPGGRVGISLQQHAGGTWKLQHQPAEGAAWVDTGVTFADNGIKSFDSFAGAWFRLTGGTVGAVAWAMDGSYRNRGAADGPEA